MTQVRETETIEGYYFDRVISGQIVYSIILCVVEANKAPSIGYKVSESTVFDAGADPRLLKRGQPIEVVVDKQASVIQQLHLK
jgi:hypothetical protein